jgi:hypothetical protein
VLQVPGPTNYSMVFYFLCDKPIEEGSLLHRFIHGDDVFRNKRFKLIPSIVKVGIVVHDLAECVYRLQPESLVDLNVRDLTRSVPLTVIVLTSLTGKTRHALLLREGLGLAPWSDVRKRKGNRRNAGHGAESLLSFD